MNYIREVKKTCSIFLLSIYLLCSTELRELSKIGAFVTHYFEHKESNQDLSLIDFIELHYSRNTSKNSDFDKDMKLPFKAHDCSSHQNSENSYFSILHCLIQEPISSLKSVNVLRENSYLPSSYLSDIWQPPRA